MLTVIRLFIAMIAAVATALGGAVAVQAAPADDSSGLGASLSASGRWYGAMAIAFDDGAAGWSNGVSAGATAGGGSSGASGAPSPGALSWVQLRMSSARSSLTRAGLAM